MSSNMVTEDLLESKIRNVTYTRYPDSHHTSCIITTENGFTVMGEYPCDDPAKYDKAKCEMYAYEDAFNKLWPLEGYLLKQRLHDEEKQVEKIARICHEANRILCEGMGDLSQPMWDFAPDWQKASARNGVKAHLVRELTPEQSHQLWLNEKEATGWVYGEKKDSHLKTHPCIRPYSMLPKEQQIKDSMFHAIVQCFKE